MIRYLIWIILFIGGSWWLDKADSYQLYICFSALLCLPYVWQVAQPKNPLPIKHAMGMAFFAGFLTPVVLETDHLRYIWDGLSTLQGINPYASPPAGFQKYHDWFWARSINHAELVTIYPPLSQLTFAASACLNPFLWSVGGFEPQSLWQVEFGWKLLVGFMGAGCVWVWRWRRFDLLLLHPLFLTKGLGNGHIDLFLVLLFAGVFSWAVKKRGEIWENLLLCAAILVKWYPFIFLPLFMVRWIRKVGRAQAISALVLGLVLVAASSMVYIPGAQGNFFDSFLVYSKHWYFFGYIHRILADVWALFFEGDGIQEAKLVCMALGALLGLVLLASYLKRYISFNLTCLLLMLGYFALNPTLHPWYLLAVLSVGLPYIRVLRIVWLWPLLSLASGAYYFDYEDPVLVRYLVYGVITFIAVLDGKKIIRLSRKRLFAASPDQAR